MPTPHNNASYGDFAKVVLMPGDPLRAKWIAETFLHDVKLVTDVRCAYGFTGYTKNNKRISVMSSGMGMPSISIYSQELYSVYGVETIIRVGTCGSYQPQVKLGDIVIAQAACADSNRMSGECYNGTYSAIGTFPVLLTAYRAAQELQKNVHVGNVLSADIFYDFDPNRWKRWAGLGVLAVEMETYALYAYAAANKKQALGIFTVTDSFCSGEKMSAQQRQSGLFDMVEVAIAAAEKYAE